MFTSARNPGTGGCGLAESLDGFEKKVKEHLAILYEDADLVAVDKPAGVPTIPARGDDPDSILARLRKQLDLPAVGEVDARLRVVHRIDRDTSGVLLMAKHLSAQRMLSDQFRHRAVSKQYLAIVSGRPTEPGRSRASSGPIVV